MEPVKMIWIWLGGVMVAAIPSVLSIVFSFRLNKHQKKVEEREKERAEREFLQLENTNAFASVIKELYVCIFFNRTPNGELEEAFQYMQDSKHRLEEYLRKIASKK